MGWHNLVKSYLTSIIRDEVISVLDGKSITVLGGTGFIGKWMVSALLESVLSGNANIRINLVARNSRRVLEHFPASKDLINIIEQDLLTNNPTILLPKSDFFVYAATPTTPSSGLKDGLNLSLQSNYGLDLILQSAQLHHNCPRVLHLSSGIVYGVDRSEDRAIFETNNFEVENVSDPYYQAKLLIEKRIVEATRADIVVGANARLFAFAGPGLSLSDHFAVGNFMADALLGRDILIKGNPQSKRSYMHPLDLTLWLLKILCNPTLDPINVGSDKQITLMDLAKLISNISSKSKIIVMNEGSSPNYYYPETINTRRIYGVQETIELEKGLADWYRFLKRSI